MLLIRDPVELYESKSLFLYEDLTMSELKGIRELVVPEAWTEIKVPLI